MKFLLVRPGPEIVEKTLFGPWKPELSHLKDLYGQTGEMFRFLCLLQIVSPAPLLAIGSFLKEKGEEVEVLDIPLDFGLPLREEQKKKRHEKIVRYIEKADCDVVGISCTSTFETLASVHVAEAAREASPEAKVILGGYQASAIAEELMKETDAVHAVVLGDFEPIGEDLVRAFEGTIPLREVPNIYYRENGTVGRSRGEVRQVKLDEYPYYDFGIVDKYIPSYIMYSIEASRGCPYSCSYCQERTLRKYYVMKNPERAVDELVEAAKRVAARTNVAFFYYSDPLWGLKRSWVRTFCETLIARREEIPLKHFGWFICTRVGGLKAREFTLLKQAKCANIGYGVESLSVGMLKKMGRTDDIDTYFKDVHEAVHLTLENRIQMYISVMVGMPGETPETLKETVEGLKKLPIEDDLLRIFVFLAYPLPKTLLEQQLNDEEFVKATGVHVWAEPTWREGYFPKITPLFDPSPALDVRALTQFYTDLSYGNLGIPSFLQRMEALKGVKGILEKSEITPEDYQKWARLYQGLMKTLSNLQ